jgi:hypothetical protein
MSKQGVLAYVFTHWKNEETSAEEYEALLADFHSSLRSHPPRGFQRSFVFATGPVPWIEWQRSFYEDWYLLDNSATLDVIAEAAVSEPHNKSHDAIARCAGGGKGALYRLVQGTIVEAPQHAYWFSKPAGLSYSALYDLMKPSLQNSALWIRQLVLGASPEFCLHSSRALQLPATIRAVDIPLRNL